MKEEKTIFKPLAGIELESNILSWYLEGYISQTIKWRVVNLGRMNSWPVQIDVTCQWALPWQPSSSQATQTILGFLEFSHPDLKSNNLLFTNSKLLLIKITEQGIVGDNWFSQKI